MTTVAALGEVADINPREKQRPDPHVTVSFVPMAALDSETAETGPGTERPFAEVQKGYTIFRDRDVLVAKITPCFENNKIGQARLSRPVGVGSTEFHVVRPRPGLLDARYVLHFLRQRRVLIDGERRMTGSGGQRRVPTQFLKDLAIPVPPLEEQRRIAAILDQADALRAKRRKALALLDDLTQSIFIDMFGDPTQGGGLRPLHDLVEFRYGTSNKSGPGGYPALRIPNVVGGKVDTGDLKTVEVTEAEFKRLVLEPGDLLFVRTNGNADNVGRSAVFSPEAVAGSGHPADRFIYASYLIRARLMPTLDSVFLNTFLATSLGRRQLRANSKTSAGQYNINIDGLGSVLVPHASLKNQRDFAARAAAVGAQRSLVDRSLAVEDRLFTSLQARAFSGKL